MELPGRIESIIGTLFPQRNTSARYLLAIDDEDELDSSMFTPSELREAASCLPNGKAPGPDGIPNEVLRAAVKTHPEYFAATFNSCIRNAYYPPQYQYPLSIPEEIR